MASSFQSFGSLSNNDGYGNEIATKQEYNWLKDGKILVLHARHARHAFQCMSLPYSTKQQHKSAYEPVAQHAGAYPGFP